MSQPRFIRGSELLVFAPESASVIGSSASALTAIACETDCTLTLNVNPIETTSKCSGKWNASMPDTLGWNISCNYLYCNHVDMLMKAAIDRTTLHVTFAVASGTESGNVVTHTPVHTLDGDDFAWYEGDVWISSLSMQGTNGSEATFSVEFTGTGALTQVLKS